MDGGVDIMANSKIIKELANGTIDLNTSLKRAKVIFQKIGSTELNQWIKNEIEGYKKLEDIPLYRRVKGCLKGCYIEGGLNCKNLLIPLDNVEEEIIEGLTYNSAGQSIYALQEAIKTGQSFVRRLETYECKWLSAKTGRIIYEAEVETDTSQVMNIIPVVENLLLETFLLLEKEFGVLDDLDIDWDSKTEDEQQVIVEKIIIIFQDNSVSVGDGNKIKNSTVASNISNKAS